MRIKSLSGLEENRSKEYCLKENCSNTILPKENYSKENSSNVSNSFAVS